MPKAMKNTPRIKKDRSYSVIDTAFKAITTLIKVDIMANMGKIEFGFTCSFSKAPFSPFVILPHK